MPTSQKRLTLYLPADLIERIDRIIPKIEQQYPGMRLSRNAAMRGAIERWLKAEEEKAKEA